MEFCALWEYNKVEAPSFFVEIIMFKLLVKIILAICVTTAVVLLALPACGLISGSDDDSDTDTIPYVYGEELITNGDFSDSINWEFYTNYSSPIFAQGSGIITNGEYRMQMTQLSQNDTIEGWHGALWYMGNVPIVQGSSYEISFDAKATGKVMFGPGLILNKEPHTYYGGFNRELSSEMRNYIGYITMEHPSDSAPLLNFAIGDHLELVTIDNISFREVVSGYGL